MQVLVFNAGSSSLKFGIFSVGTETREVFKGSYERFRGGGCEYRFRHGETDERGSAEFGSPGEALKGVPAALKRFGLDTIDAVGHRIVHGGAKFSVPTLLDDEIVEAVAALTSLAPLHLPANLEAVRLCRGFWPDLPQLAVFDTAFHLSNPAFATTYAVPARWRDAGLRRYGFHGTSH
jgi:acetate kinase